MKNITLLLLACMFILPSFGQRSRKDQVFLKSGGVIKGQLITHDAEIVKINSEGNQWVFKNSEVDSILKFKDSRIREKVNLGYFFDTSMGVLIGGTEGSRQRAPFSFMSSFNVKVFPNLYLGAGLGAEFLQETHMPVFGQMQWRFRDSRTTPFINLQAGYMVPLEDGNSTQTYYPAYSDYMPSLYYPSPTTSKIKADGGYMINPSFGFQHYSSDNFGWFFSFGYRYHQLNYSGDNDYQLETNFSRLSLKIGFIFN